MVSRRWTSRSSSGKAAQSIRSRSRTERSRWTGWKSRSSITIRTFPSTAYSLSPWEEENEREPQRLRLLRRAGRGNAGDGREPSGPDGDCLSRRDALAVQAEHAGGALRLRVPGAATAEDARRRRFVH